MDPAVRVVSEAPEGKAAREVWAGLEAGLEAEDVAARIAVVSVDLQAVAPATSAADPVALLQVVPMMGKEALAASVAVPEAPVADLAVWVVLAEARGGPAAVSAQPRRR